MSCGGCEVTVVGSIAFADPTADVQLVPINGVANTAMRSDAAPALDQGIAPIWTNLHQFLLAIRLSGDTTIQEGTGDPNGQPAGFAGIGSLWLRDDAPDIDHLLYGKTTAIGLNTGWTPFTAGVGTTINSLDTYLPYRVNGTTFGDTPLHIVGPNNVQCNNTFYSDIVAPAIGGSVTGFCRAGGSILNNGIDAGVDTTGTGVFEELFGTAAIPKDSMAQGGVFSVKCCGLFASNANAKEFQLLFHDVTTNTDTVIYDSAGQTINGGAWEFTADICIDLLDQKKQVTNAKLIAMNHTPQVVNMNIISTAFDNTTATGHAFQIRFGAIAAAGDVSLFTGQIHYNQS